MSAQHVNFHFRNVSNLFDQFKTKGYEVQYAKHLMKLCKMIQQKFFNVIIQWCIVQLT